MPRNGAGPADWGMIQDIMRYSKDRADWSSLDDEEVLRLSKSQPDAFGELVRRYEAPFLRKAQSILYSREEAEEAVQDAFTRIYLYADTYHAQEGAQFTSWAYVILTRLCLTRYQKLKRERGRVADIDPELYERLPDAENFLEKLSAKHEVILALSKLPESFSRVLRLQFLEGKTQEEIAELEGSTVPAVKTRVHRAKKLLRTTLTHHD